MNEINFKYEHENVNKFREKYQKSLESCKGSFDIAVKKFIEKSDNDKIKILAKALKFNELILIDDESCNKMLAYFQIVDANILIQVNLGRSFHNKLEEIEKDLFWKTKEIEIQEKFNNDNIKKKTKKNKMEHRIFKQMEFNNYLDRIKYYSMKKDLKDWLNRLEEEIPKKFRFVILTNRINQEMKFLINNQNIADFDSAKKLLLNTYDEKFRLDQIMRLNTHYNSKFNKIKDIRSFILKKIKLIEEIYKIKEFKYILPVLMTLIPKDYIESLEKDKNFLVLDLNKVLNNVIKTERKRKKRDKSFNNNKKKEDNNNKKKKKDKKEFSRNTVFFFSKDTDEVIRKNFSEVGVKVLKLIKEGHKSYVKIEKEDDIKKLKQFYPKISFSYKDNEIKRLEDKENRILIQINDKIIKVLIDSGASHSLISKSFADELKIDYEEVEEKRFNTADKQLRSNTRTKIKFDISGQSGLEADCYILNITDKIILGRDFMKTYNISISTNYIKFRKPFYLKLNFLSEEVNNLIINYNDIFKKNGDPIKDFEMKLFLKDPNNIVMKNRKIPIHQEEIVEQTIKEWLELDIIEKTNDARISTPLLIVSQKSSVTGQVKNRCCGGFMGLNNNLVDLRADIPNIKHMLWNVKESDTFSSLDLSKGYMQVSLNPDDRYLTAFETNSGRYQFKRIPFGISTAPSYFNSIIKEIFDQDILKYFDDLLIASKSDDHFEMLDRTFEKARDYNVRFSFSKSSLYKDQLIWAGYRIDKNGVSLNRNKAIELKSINCPSSRKELESVLASLNYFSRFLPKLSIKLGEFYENMKQDKEFKFDNNDWKNLSNVIDEVVDSKIIFKSPNIKEEFTVEVDSGINGYAALIMQSHGLIDLLGGKFNHLQSKYNPPKRELFGIYQTLKKSEYLLRFAKIKIKTDCKTLKKMIDKGFSEDYGSLNWLAFISEFSPEVIWVPRNELDFVDRVGRIVNNSIIEEMDNEIKIISQEEQVERNEKIKKFLQNNNEENLLNILPWFHDKENHRSIQDVLEDKIFKENEFTIDIKKIISKYINECLNCQLNKKNANKVFGVGKIYDILERVHCDVLGPVDGLNLLLVVDAASNYVWVEKFVNDINSDDVIESFSRIFSEVGYPDQIIFDNAKYFDNTKIKLFLEKKGVEIKDIPPFSQYKNSHAELSVQKIKLSIQKILNVSNWKEKLNDNLFKLRNQRNSVTKFSPAERIYGRKLRGNQILSSSSNSHEKINEISKERQMKERSARLSRSKEPREFMLDQLVTINNNNTQHKFEQRRNGPFKIKSKVDEFNYKVSDRDDKVKLVAVNQLIKFQGEKELDFFDRRKKKEKDYEIFNISKVWNEPFSNKIHVLAEIDGDECWFKKKEIKNWDEVERFMKIEKEDWKKFINMIKNLENNEEVDKRLKQQVNSDTFNNLYDYEIDQMKKANPNFPFQYKNAESTKKILKIKNTSKSCVYLANMYFETMKFYDPSDDNNYHYDAEDLLDQLKEISKK